MSKLRSRHGSGRRLSGFVAFVFLCGPGSALSTYAQADRATLKASSSKDRRWSPLREQCVLPEKPTRKVRGVVRTSSGVPIRGAVVGLYRNIGGVPRKLYFAGHSGLVHLCSSTDEAGEFVTYLPSSGEYAFYATPQFRLGESLKVIWVESSCEDEETLAPAWSSESTATNMKWISGPATEVEPLIVVTCRYLPSWRLEGRVTSSSGVVLWNYEVAVEPIEGLDPSVGEMVVHVDGDGRWSVCGLPDGRYRVTAYPDEQTKFEKLPLSTRDEVVFGEIEIRGANASIVLQVPPN